jgi:hypothetical protein
VHRVFVDSNVLGSRTLYDWLFILRAQSEMFSLVTTPDVLDEAHRVWRRVHPTAGGAARASRESKFRDAFDEIIEDWTGGDAANVPDRDDQHVHNAAVYSQANILLTMNIKDFGDPDLLPYDLYTPDQFLCLVESSSPFVVREATKVQLPYWQGRRDKGDTVKSLSDALKDAGTPAFATVIAAHLQVLSGPTD